MTTNNTNAGLPIHPILESGLIIFARAHYRGTRTVTFEDPATCDHTILDGTVSTKNSHFGSGENIDVALTQALYSFHQNNSDNYKSLYNTKERTYKITSLLGKLDTWLVENKGSLRAFSDFDGSILVNLKGLSNPTDTNSPSISLHGWGNTFYEALFSAFNGSFDHQNYAMPVKQVKITTVAEEPVEHLIVATKKAKKTTSKLKIQKRARLSYN